MTNSTKKTIAIAKLTNLASALEAIGVDTEMYEICNGCPYLGANLWSCEDGSTIRLEIMADKDDDYEFEVVANPLGDIGDFVNAILAL